MHKRTYTHLVHFLFIAFLLAPLAQIKAELGTVTVAHKGRSYEVVQQHLFVRMHQTRDAETAQMQMPAGFRIVEQLLQPEQTKFFRGQTAQKLVNRPNGLELYSSEERLTRTFVVEYVGPVSPFHMASLLMTKFADRIEIAEPWFVARTQGVPNDPEIANQYHLQTIRAQQAWDVYQGSETVTIAISDDGIQQDHEDLGPNIAINDKEIPENGLDDDANGYIDDYNGYNFAYQVDGTKPGSTTSITAYGHGTKVAGLAAAATNNGKGIAGVGYKSRMFPLKTSKRSGGGILFGYQSLIYCASRGLPVVNTSWGVVKPYSQIDQSVIDYCLASNVLVVASGGNHGEDEPSAAWRLVNFPSGYRGVFGIGETTVDDRVTNTSGVGVNADVYAPGYSAYTTDVSTGYTSFGVAGTSFASPMVAGLAGLVRGKWPALTPQQVAEHIRQTSDDISNANNTISDFAPRRINAERALMSDPFALPSVRITGSTVRRANTSEPRFRAGDTIEMVLLLTNYLADVNLETVLRVNDANGWELRILNEGQNVGMIQKGSVKTMQPFRLIVDAIGNGECVFSLQMSGNTYEDRDFVMLPPPTTMNRFENDKLIYSMSDDGMVGYSAPFDPKYGDGFGFKPTFSMLASGGMFAQMQSVASVAAYKNDPPFTSDFVSSKPFGRLPDRSSCTMSDSAAFQPIGIEVQQQCVFPSQTSQATVWNVTVRPSNTNAILENIGLGYVFDWDLGSGGSDNRIVHDNSCIPEALRGQQSAAFVVTRDAFPASVCVATVGAEPSQLAQAACMLLEDVVDDGDGFTPADRIRLLTSGTSIVTDAIGDIAGSIGMLTLGEVSSAKPLSFRVIIGAGSSAEDARRAVNDAIDATTSIQEQAVLTSYLYPNPTNGNVWIADGHGAQRIEITDISGRTVMSSITNDGATHVNIAALAKGVYSVAFFSINGVLLHVETLICN